VPVLIVNQSAVSFELQASLVYPVLNSIELEFSAERLRGVAEERRVLKVIMHAPGIVDITVAFRPKNDMSDLGGRDQTHFLLRCA
jgi:hypothetical protein